MPQFDQCGHADQQPLGADEGRPTIPSPVMRELVWRGLLRIKVRPYYLFHCDPVTGAGHFRTSIWKGMEIIEGLRGHVSGLGIPTYVVDGLHGAGKIPVMPNYMLSSSDDAVVLRNYEGMIFRYAPEDKPRTGQADRVRRRERSAQRRSKAVAAGEQPANGPPSEDCSRESRRSRDTFWSRCPWHVRRWSPSMATARMATVMQTARSTEKPMVTRPTARQPQTALQLMVSRLPRLTARPMANPTVTPRRWLSGMLPSRMGRTICQANRDRKPNCQWA